MKAAIVLSLVPMLCTVSPVMSQQIGQYQAVALPLPQTEKIARALILDTKNGDIWEYSVYADDSGPHSTLRYEGKVAPGQTVNPIPDYPGDSPRCCHPSAPAAPRLALLRHPVAEQQAAIKRMVALRKQGLSALRNAEAGND